VDTGTQSWHCLQLAIPQSCSEDVSVCCFELGSCGLHTEEEGETTRLIAYFDASLDVEVIRQQLEASLGGLGLAEAEVAVQRVAAQDWEAAWRRFFRPVWATPRIVVHPSWIPVDIDAEQVAVVIDPQMAFGTGGHESTQLCLRGLEACLQPGDCCLDLGTGSGVLAIAAARLGAGRVLALDVEPRAVENARANLARNGIDAGRVEVRQGSVDQVAGEVFELILANIQSHVLRPLLGPARRLLAAGGRALFSGLLAREEQEFCRWVEGAGLRVEAVHAKNSWICVVARKGG